MKKIIDNYLKIQKEHLNSLDNLFYANNELNKVSESITNSFTASKANIDHLADKLETLEVSYNLAELELLREKLANNQDIENTYKELSSNINLKLQNEKDTLNKTYDDLIKETDRYIKELESDKLKQLNDTSNRYNLSILKLKQENKLVDTTISNEKKKYLKKAKELTEELESNLTSFDVEFNRHLSSFEALETQIMQQTNILIEETEQEYSNFSENHKQNILSNKQNFYNTTEILNDKINEINKNYKVLIDENQLNLKISLNKLDFENKEFFANLQAETRDVLNQFEKQLVRIDSKIDTLKKDFETKENILNAIFNKDITSINVLFQQEKNEYNKQLNTLIKEFEQHSKQNIQISSSYEKSFLKYKNQIENSLKILENITQTKILERKKVFFKEKYALNKNFLRRQAIYRSLRFVKDEKKNATLNYGKRKQDIFNNYYETNNTRLETLYSHQKDIIESKMAIEISPLDGQISNARLVHFNESSLLNFEQSYKRDAFLNNKSTILYQSHLELLSLKLESTILKTNYEYEVDNLKGNSYLQIQYEKNVFDNIVKEEAITKQINQSVNELKSLKRKHKDDLFVIGNNSKIEKETAKLNVSVEKKKVQETVLKEQLIYELEKLKLNKQKDINAYLALENIKNSALENEHQQKIVNVYFQMLESFKEERTIFKETITNIASNDDFLLTQSLPIFKELLISQNQISSDILDSLLVLLVKQIQEKIDAHKLTEYDKKYIQIINEYESIKAETENKLTLINEEIKNNRNNILLIYQLIEKLKEENIERDTLKKLISTQIKGLKHHFDAQSKKTIKQLKIQIVSLNEEIKANKLIISKSNQTIKEKNQELSNLNTQLKPLVYSFKNIDKIKENKIRDLDLQHHKDTLPLLTTIENLNDSINKFKEINTALFTEFDNIIGTYSSSSDNLIDKRIVYIFNAVDENFTNTYTSLSLLIEHLFIYYKKEQLKIEQEFTNNYQLSLSYLSKRNYRIIKNSEVQLADLSTYLITLLERHDRLLVRNLRIANKIQKRELKKAAIYIKSLRDYKKEITENNKNLLTAFQTNHHEVIKLNKKTHAHKIKEIKKDINLEIKQIQEQLKKNILEATLKDQAYQARIKTLAKKHNKNKEALTTKLKKRNLSHKSRISNYSEIIKSITPAIEIAPTKRDFKIKYSKKYLINYQQRKIKKIKRELRKNIFKSTKQYKNNLKNSL